MEDITKYMGIVGWVMNRRKVRKRLPAYMADEVESDLMVALWTAAKNHDPARGKFSTYAFYCLNAVCSGNGRRGRGDSIQLKTHRATTPVGRVRLFSAMGRYFTYSSVFATQPSAGDVAAEIECRGVSDHDTLLRLLKKLEWAQREVIELRYAVGKCGVTHTLNEVGERLGVSGARVHQIEMKAILLLKNMHEEGK